MFDDCSIDMEIYEAILYSLVYLAVIGLIAFIYVKYLQHGVVKDATEDAVVSKNIANDLTHQQSVKFMIKDPIIDAKLDVYGTELATLQAKQRELDDKIKAIKVDAPKA